METEMVKIDKLEDRKMSKENTKGVRKRGEEVYSNQDERKRRTEKE